MPANSNHHHQSNSHSSDAADAARRLGLTRRELDILRLIAANLRNKEIGAALSITEGTVKIHVHNILSKLGVNSRAQAIAKCRRYRLVKLAPVAEIPQAVSKRRK